MFATNEIVTIAAFSAVFAVIACASKTFSIVLSFKKCKRWKILKKTKEYY